ADVLFRMRRRVGAADCAAIRRSVRVERGLAILREHGKLVAEAAVTAVAAAPPAAEADGVRSPDARDLLRVERHVRVVDLRVARARSRRAARRLSRSGANEKDRSGRDDERIERRHVGCAQGCAGAAATSGYGTESDTMSAPSRLRILITKPTSPPARAGAIVMLIFAPGASACSERAFVQPTRSKPAGFGNSSPAQCTTAPLSSVKSKKICGCGFA